MNARLCLVLLGGGHNHLPVIAVARDWQEAVDVTLVSPDTQIAATILDADCQWAQEREGGSG